jgi:hypothetical protein
MGGVPFKICDIVNRLILKTLFGPRIGGAMHDPDKHEEAFRVIGYRYTEAKKSVQSMARYSNATDKKLRADRAYVARFHSHSLSFLHSDWSEWSSW